MKKVNFELKKKKNFGQKLKNLGRLTENKEFSRSVVNKRAEIAQSLPISNSIYEKFSNPAQDERRTPKELH